MGGLNVFVILHFVNYLRARGLQQSAYNLIRSDCKLNECDFQITFEHSSQISAVQELGVTENKCKARLAGINNPDLTAVYCPDNHFCGLDLIPEHNKQLKPGFNKSCLVFAKTENVCRDIEQKLLDNG